MGKPKSHSLKAKKLAKKKGILTNKPSEPSYTLEEILTKAEEFMNEYKYELAQKFCQRALEMDNDNVRALELSGSLLLEMGEIDSARHCYGRAVVVQPDSGHSKYMTLAQLFTGMEAKNIYVKGIEVLTNTITQADGASSEPEKVLELRRELSTAWVAMSELYMTDLCDEEEAETESQKCIEQAVVADDTNPEAHQAMASFLLVKEDVDGARAAITKSISLWLPQYVAVLERGGDEECRLDYNTRLVTAKILIEVEDWNNGAAVLEGLVEEDDEVVAAWYLLGWLHHLKNDEDSVGNVRFYLGKAKQVHVMNPTDDDAMVDHIEEILAEVGPGEDSVESGTALPDILEQDELTVDRVADILDREAEKESSDIEQMED